MVAELADDGVAAAEGWRLPAAGLVTTVLFDKTGTLTTDQVGSAPLIIKQGAVVFTTFKFIT